MQGSADGYVLPGEVDERMIWLAVAVVAVVLVVVAMRLVHGGVRVSPPPPSHKDSAEDRRDRSGGGQDESEDKEEAPPRNVMERGPGQQTGVPPQASYFGDDWEDVDITLVGEMSPELRALQKGYRSVDPKQAVAEVYDDTADVEIVGEEWVDGLLVEELLNDDVTGPYALVLVEGRARTDRGLRRANNEDQVLSVPDYFVYGVADGMGGHAAGEVASELAVDTIEKAFRDGAIEGEPNDLWPRRGDELARTLEMANRAIYTSACSDHSLRGMGTTVTAIRFCPQRQRAYIAHVGDSRCYRVRDGELLQLTKDHTLGAELGARGRMATHLSRSIGISEWVEVDLMVDAPKPGDRYIVCSDGLTKMISEDRITEITLEKRNLEECVNQLIDEANAAGGKDNVTVALMEIRAPLSGELE